MQGRISPQLLEATGTGASPFPGAAFADQALSAAGLVLAAVLGLVGIALWLFGARLMKPGTALAGALLGAGAGIALVTHGAALGIGEPPPLPAAVGLGALFGLGAAILLYRMVVATIAATTFAALGFLAVGAAWGPALGSNLGASTVTITAPVQEQAPEMPSNGYVVLGNGTVIRTSNPDPATQPPGSGPDLSFASSASGLQAAWQTMDPAQRSAALLAGGLCGLGGLFFGFISPRRTAAAISALAGSAAWLAAAVWLTRSQGLPGAALTDRTPAGWLITWVLVAGFGFAVQAFVTARRPAHPQPVALA